MFEKKILQESDPYKRELVNKEKPIKNVYWGEVISIDDNYEGGRIKVKIADLDTKIPDENLPFCYPLMPKYFHVYPQVGEVVRVLIEDTTYPQRSRYWIGSVVSQLQKIGYDGVFTALNTTNIGRGTPEKAISQYPAARGVFPEKNHVALIGKNNTDIVLKDREVQIRAGKHEVDNIFELNKKNPASFTLTHENVTGNSETRSMSLILSDVIALISHDGIPKFKASNLTKEDRDRIIKQAHPTVRGDILVEILEIFRKAIFQHIHPYDGLPSDKSGSILDLEKLNLENLKQNNILIN